MILDEIEVGGIYQLKLSGDRVMVLTKGQEMERQPHCGPTYKNYCLVRKSIGFEKIYIYPFELEIIE